MARRLNSHPTARLSDGVPSMELTSKYVRPVRSENGNEHWFWEERSPNRGHDPGGQAIFQWRGLTYNVARVLLQHRHKTGTVRAVNTCGLPQCVRPDHWSIAPPFLGVVASPVFGTDYATVRVDGAWRLSRGGDVLSRDVVFVAASGGAPVRHVVRALHEEHETVFYTACEVMLDPASVVAGGEATCEACLR